MIYRSPYPSLQIPDMDLSSLILERAKKFGKRIALIDAISGKQITYAEFYNSVLSIARGLHRLGFQKGDVFGVYAPNCIEYAFAMHAVFLLGGTLTTANPLFTSSELASQLKDAGARFLLTSPSHVQKTSEALHGLKEIFVTGESFNSLYCDTGTIPDVILNPSEDVAALPYSSGTTGFPKGVVLTHRNLVANILQIEQSKIFTAGETVVCVLPLFHIYGLVVILNESLFLGSTVVLLPRYDLETLLKTIETYRVTIAPLVPPIVLALAKESIVANYNLSCLQTIFSAAAPLAPNLIREFRARIGCAIKQGYGMTEASPATHMSLDPSDSAKDGSVGVLVPNTECKIVNELGSELGPNEPGEICVRGPQVMKGYLNCPDATQLVLDHQGWLRTGDIGYADEESNFFIVDRVKELIKYKGFQVAPAEIEAVLLSHPTVADAVVIPSPDPIAGEVPKAFVVLTEEISLEIILEFVSARVAPHKRVRKIERIDQIPKSPSGKILRRILVEKERNRCDES
jgi:acyl-CoA synthetase (AMP-forming)/AMP-acid ligase II